MKLNKELSKKLTFLIDTLTMARLIVECSNDAEIEDCLEELEGDYYTFFDQINLIDLAKANVLNDFQVEKIIALKNKIGNIDRSLWNKIAVKTDQQWAEVQQSSNEILNSLKML